MRNGIKAARRARYWLTLLTVFPVVISSASTLSATAAIVAGSASLLQSPRADDLAEGERLTDEAIRLYRAGKYAEAIPLAERLLTITEKAIGPDHPGVATVLDFLAELYGAKGEYAKAEPLYQRALAIREKTLDPNHPEVAISLNNLAMLYARKGDYAKAEPLYQRALVIFEKALGPDHPKIALYLNNLAELYEAKDDYVKAEPLHQRVLAIREKGLGPDHPLVATSLNKLAMLYEAKGDYAKAEPLYQRTLAIREKALGPDHLDVAKSLNNLAGIYNKKGDYAKAEQLHLHALAIKEKALGPDHPDVAISLHNLAESYRAKGDYAKAEPLCQRALAIREKALGSDHPLVATSLNSLAGFYNKKGDYAKAEQLHQRALAIREKGLGPDHPDVAIDLNNLANLYRAKGDYAKAEPLFQRALAIFEKALGPDHPTVAAFLNNLAALYGEKGDYAKAEPLYQRALTIDEKTRGPNHSFVAIDLSNLATLYAKKGDYAKAEPLFQRALAVFEKALGPNHPDVAVGLYNLAALYRAKGDVTRAVAFCRRAADISERNITLNLAPGSERQTALYLATFSGETHQTVSLHVQSAPNDPAALRLALTTVLRRKGRVLDATVDTFAALRQRFNPEDSALLDQLTNTRSQLATLVLSGPGKTDPAEYRTEIQRLEDQAEKLEAQVSSRSREFRAQSQPVTLEAVQAAIPQGAALVEFLVYSPSHIKKEEVGTPSLVAYVLGHTGEPQWVDLGEAAEIYKLISELRGVLRWDEDKKMLSDIEREVKPKARALDQRIMQPVRRLLGNTRTLLISPDGGLNLIPFAALVDEKNRYLIESYSLGYLTTGRDLLRLQAQKEGRKGTTIFADPDFEADQTVVSGRSIKAKKADKKTDGGKNAAPVSAEVVPQNLSPSIDFSQVLFPPLRGTAEEARALKALFPDAVVWTQAQATKTRLKRIDAPAILHIATHGFFLDNLVVSAAGATGRGLFIRPQRPQETAAPDFHVEDPLLRSGLAFAGANLHRGGDDNGILTAKEASGLNLWGTKLVVLSACDTGIGEIEHGEGIYGLRRALVLAGSETQVMSLWPVNDAGTRDLMIDYYNALKAGHGRSEALRQVQLGMLKSKDHKHPYYWASFIQSGEWANLDGKR